ncbi:MAG: M20/M25/M40 family metallo-hydrolase, partial [Herbinix sp.]|nr:M20/M25/M40 family metallo-hydrolase [Herbinix sp.]
EEITEQYNTLFDFDSDYGCLAYEVADDHSVVKKFETACTKLGYDMKLIDTFGGSDNNNFLRNGITGIVIACGMNQVHSCREFTHIDELIKCSNIVIKLLTE